MRRRGEKVLRGLLLIPTSSLLTLTQLGAFAARCRSTMIRIKSTFSVPPSSVAKECPKLRMVGREAREVTIGRSGFGAAALAPSAAPRTNKTPAAKDAVSPTFFFFTHHSADHCTGMQDRARSICRRPEKEHGRVERSITQHSGTHYIAPSRTSRCRNATPSTLSWPFAPLPVHHTRLRSRVKVQRFVARS